MMFSGQCSRYIPRERMRGNEKEKGFRYDRGRSIKRFFHPIPNTPVEAVYRAGRREWVIVGGRDNSRGGDS